MYTFSFLKMLLLTRFFPFCRKFLIDIGWKKIAEALAQDQTLDENHKRKNSRKKNKINKKKFFYIILFYLYFHLHEHYFNLK